ncbi:CBS domain-containing protein [Pseudonocardia alaniniphila]|uniref:CBS domain-containing protein n=1 Tax=Pseudonocardia alaniniphila TaxID=75291 RepID=A0ABS9T6I4_9PSEU|nr:CBS domain-containing protein [Pseudonocardia alaniniphila]MCH6164146.1 CBS domain-containing protein [Pseudonocardia alaniniphila]
MRIREIMSSPAVVVPPEMPVKDAAALLASHSFTCLPVVAGDGRLVGVVGEAELLEDRFPPDPRLPLDEREDRDPGDAVADVMERDVLTAHPQEGVADLLTVLRSANIRSLPVVEDGVVIGVITYRDLVHALARDDGLIEADVRRRLNLCGGVGRWRATVRDGEVTIFDERRDPSDRNAAVRVAESVIGVTRCRVVETSTLGG